MALLETKPPTIGDVARMLASLPDHFVLVGLNLYADQVTVQAEEYDEGGNVLDWIDATIEAAGVRDDAGI